MISDYATLRGAVASWLARADLTSAIPDFITLAEARINRTLRSWQRQGVAAGTSVASEIPIPADLYDVQSLRVFRAGQWGEIFPVPLTKLLDCKGLPTGYALTGGVLRLQGTQDVDYELAYRATVPALSDIATQNWLLTREPGIYLYGALIEAAPYIKDDARAQIWAMQYQTLLDDLNVIDDGARYGNAPALVGPAYAP